MKSDPRLRRWYRRFNHLFFNDELPDDVPVIWMPLGPCAGLTIMEFAQGTKLVSYQIQLDTSLMGLRKYAQIVLLHEMVHVKLRCRRVNMHGKKFKEELQRVFAFPQAFKLLC